MKVAPAGGSRLDESTHARVGKLQYSFGGATDDYAQPGQVLLYVVHLYDFHLLTIEAG